MKAIWHLPMGVFVAAALWAANPALAGDNAAPIGGDTPKAATTVMPAFITAGALDPNNVIPTVDGVPGAGIGNLDIAWPDTVLTHGTIYVYQVAAQNTTFGGTCDVTYKLTQVQKGKTVVLDSGTINPSYSCAAGTNWAVGNRSNAVPDSPGPATLTGTITYGSKKVSTKVSVVIQ